MCLYDIRTGKAERRIVMAVSGWHPIAQCQNAHQSVVDALEFALVVPDSAHSHASCV